MKVNRKGLLAALKLVEPGLAKDSKMEQDGCFVFTEDGRVCTFNNNVSISYPIAVGIVGAVPSKGLLGMCEKTKAEEVELTIINGDGGSKEVMFVGSKAKAGLRMEAKILLPLDMVGFPEVWEPLPENFNAALKFSLFSAGKDQNKAAFTGIHVMSDCLESCDNNRATRYYFVEGAPMVEMLIPAAHAKELIGYKCDEFAVTPGWLHFRNPDDVTFSCRYLEEEYPDLDKFLECVGEETTFPEGMSEILDRAEVLSDGDKVNVYLESKRMIISTEGSHGWFEEEDKVTYGGKPVEFDIAPNFLAAMLKLNSTIVIGPGRLLFDAQEFIHIVKTYVPKKR
jgi:DNA polymerase III sliding clamp (beta) subunit (PCNA family)